MGGQIPTSIDIYNPRMNTKVTIDTSDVEESNTISLYSTFTRENIIKLCIDSLRNVPEWKYLMERQIQLGKSVQLAWRVGANLDWIWLEEDICGNHRNWSVLCGIAFKQVILDFSYYFSEYFILRSLGTVHKASPLRGSAGRACSYPHTYEGWKANRRASLHRGLSASHKTKYADETIDLRFHSQWQPFHLGHFFCLPTHATWPCLSFELVH